RIIFGWLISCHPIFSILVRLTLLFYGSFLVNYATFGETKVGYLTIGMLYHYSQVKMLNIPIDIWPIIFIISISQILSYLPIHIFGGLGFSEMTELYLFSLFGIFTNLPAALISLRILAYLFQIIALIWLAIYAAQKDTKRTDTIL
ncbi:MAG: hypothetical protein HN741_00005, partial [Anaerolineae bacterium]|nr:hypothetical protein [Anaerolineae bacterium]